MRCRENKVKISLGFTHLIQEKNGHAQMILLLCRTFPKKLRMGYGHIAQEVCLYRERLLMMMGKHCS